jgi:ribonucleotide monophosphatase NagD (HAD superfamily)
MVGDDIRGDVDGAQQAGLRGVLVRTGKFREADLSLGIRPAAVLDSVVDLPRWYASAAPGSTG